MLGQSLYSSITHAQKKGQSARQTKTQVLPAPGSGAGSPPEAADPSPSEEKQQPEQLTAEMKFSEDHVLDAWKTSMEVQQHFNDLELRIRNFAVTLLVTVIGAAAFALKEHYEVTFLGQRFMLAVAVLLAGILGWLAFYFMDRHWYHRLLLGAVFHTVDNIEKRHAPFPEIALSRRIGVESAIPMWKFKTPRNGQTHWMEIHSSEKIDLFYASGLLFLMILIALLLGSSAPPKETDTGHSADITAPNVPYNSAQGKNAGATVETAPTTVPAPHAVDHPKQDAEQKHQKEH